MRLYESGGSCPPGFALVEPTLEDAYLVLMREGNGGAATLGAR